jgi:hypothetical protein
MKMICFGVSIILLVTASICAAEVPTYDARKPQGDGNTLVGMECHHRNMALEIGIFFPMNPPKRRMDLWNISDLVKFNPTTHFVEKIEVVDRNCNLGSSQYKIRFEGIPGANNAMWMCGAATGVHVRVWRGNTKVLDEDMYKCNSKDYFSNARFEKDVAEPKIQRLNFN